MNLVLSRRTNLAGSRSVSRRRQRGCVRAATALHASIFRVKRSMKRRFVPRIWLRLCADAHGTRLAAGLIAPVGSMNQERTSAFMVSMRQ